MDDKTEYTHFRLGLFAPTTCCRTRCVLCGDEIGKGCVVAVLEGYTDDRAEQADFGDVCRNCLDAGREGAAERMRDQAGDLRSHAEWLEQLAGDVVNAETWGSSSDLEFVREVRNEQNLDPMNNDDDYAFVKNALEAYRTRTTD